VTRRDCAPSCRSRSIRRICTAWVSTVSACVARSCATRATSTVFLAGASSSPASRLCRSMSRGDSHTPTASSARPRRTSPTASSGEVIIGAAAASPPNHHTSGRTTVNATPRPARTSTAYPTPKPTTRAHVNQARSRQVTRWPSTTLARCQACRGCLENGGGCGCGGSSTSRPDHERACTRPTMVRPAIARAAGGSQYSPTPVVSARTARHQTTASTGVSRISTKPRSRATAYRRSRRRSRSVRSFTRSVCSGATRVSTCPAPTSG